MVHTITVISHPAQCRRLKITREKLSNNESAIEPFRNELLQVINEKNLIAEQIYHVDESGLFWRMIPDKTLPGHSEKVAPGMKVIEARIAFMPCANETGKLPLLVVGTAKKPQAFKSVTLPVCCRAQKNAEVTREFFLDWFTKEFVPAIRHMKFVNLPQRDLLLLDNCPSHPSTEELCSDDSEISAMFLPPNMTELIQPMDQNVFQNIKLG